MKMKSADRENVLI